MALKSSNKVETNVYELEITVDAETFTEACKKAYMKQRKSIQIPGFRKGKATQGMIEKVYGEGAFYEEALEIVYPEAVGSAFDEAGLKVIDQPTDVEFPVMNKQDGVVIKMKVTTYPEVKLGEYKSLKGKMLDTEATDEDVENELKSMQDRNSRLVTVEDRESQMGDTCDIDFEGFVDGVAFEGGKGENYPLELGSNSFIPGFEEQVAGHKTGDEFDVNVTFPEQYEPSLAGKDAVFKCKINEIKTKELPELDDEFAKDVSEFDTLDELKADLKKQISERKEANAKTDYENQLIEQVVENMEVEIPECMNKQKCDEMIQDYSYRLQMQGLDLNTYLQYLGQTMEQFREQFMDGAKQQVKVKLALDAIVKAENIEATEEEIAEEIAKLAEQYNMEADKIKAAVPQEQLTDDIVTRKAVDFVVDNSVKE
ncbi:MAG: trigger factor [Clostridiales bacterium]|uniref:trigger factor n=2 Tax=Eubacterium TaxID=1730 RepID=UPI00262230F8|nr:trigger factor [uncultured Eubacterium sp.]MBD8929182.1 trigger factor [Clostridiales bacterium]